jgi:hypothetical protein
VLRRGGGLGYICGVCIRVYARAYLPAGNDNDNVKKKNHTNFNNQITTITTMCGNDDVYCK